LAFSDAKTPKNRAIRSNPCGISTTIPLRGGRVQALANGVKSRQAAKNQEYKPRRAAVFFMGFELERRFLMAAAKNMAFHYPPHRGLQKHAGMS
jgi:hypothetical protein